MCLLLPCVLGQAPQHRQAAQCPTPHTRTPHLLGRGRQQAPVLQQLHDDAVPEAEPRAGARLAAGDRAQLTQTL